MKAHWFSKHVGRLTYLVICIFVVCSGLRTSLAQESTYYRGEVHFMADYSVFFLPAGVSRLYFDTTECVGCRDTLPAWRFIDSLLKVDGIIRNGVYESLVADSQMAGITINSPELVKCFVENKVYKLVKSFPTAVPYDTLVWSKVRQRYNVIPDLAQVFRIFFNDSVDVHTVVSQLRSIPGIIEVSMDPIPFMDGECAPGLDPWAPNDPQLNSTK